MPPSGLFDHVSHERILPADVKRLRKLAKVGRAVDVFPPGSSAPPPLLVGRERHIGQLKALGREILKAGPQGVRPSRIGIVLHGPRGTGKTALLTLFKEEMARMKARIIALDGDALDSTHTAAAALAEVRQAHMGNRSASEHRLSVSVAPAEASYGHRREYQQAPEGLPLPSTLLSALFTGEGRASKLPVLIAIDEAHTADPRTLGVLMSATQRIASEGHPVGFCFAGTPDLLDVIRQAQAIWFLDRAKDDRLCGVGNLTESECFDAVAEPLRTLDVDFDPDALRAASGRCGGSPYFTQSLGRAGLAAAESAHGRAFADYSEGSPALAEFDRAVNLRYREAWDTLRGLGLTASARQMGVLWRAHVAGVLPHLNEDMLSAAIESGMEHAPSAHKPQVATAGEAQIRLRHLGLVWDPNRRDEWELGLPSFFTHVEAEYRKPENLHLPEARERLDADLEKLLPGVVAAANDEFERLSEPPPALAKPRCRAERAAPSP